MECRAFCCLSQTGFPSLDYVLGKNFLLAKRTVALTKGGLGILMEWIEAYENFFTALSREFVFGLTPFVLRNHPREFCEIYK